MNIGGGNKSPELSWTPGPEGTLSYAVVLTDTSIDFVHWVLWDIPADVTSLPAALPSGATLTEPEGAQQKSLSGTAYAGSGRCSNVYEHRVYALSVAKLTDATGDTKSIKTEIEKVDLVSSYVKSQSREPATGCM